MEDTASALLLQWQEMRWLWMVLAGVIGACIGSFLTLASWRIPRGESLLAPRSHCPACGTTLGAGQLVPIGSWLMQRGRCHHCALPVHWRYPLIECLTAAAFALILYVWPPGWAALLLLVLASAVILLIITDLEQWIIPDEVHWVLIPAGLAYRALLLAMEDWPWLLVGPLSGLLAGLALRYGYLWVRKRVGLGWGDVKFLATAGAWLGASGLVPFLFYGGLLGVVFALLWRALTPKVLAGEEGEGIEGTGHFPFGPALAAALCLGVYWPESYAFFWTWPQLLHH